ncbi:MAG: aminopeptidase P family protein [bacterium]
MISPDHLRRRRTQLLSRLETPALLFAGGILPRNADNEYPYRADSNFLFFFGPTEPGAAALFDPQEGRVTLYLPERSATAALWSGAQRSFAAERERLDVERIVAVEELEGDLRRERRDRPLHALAVADAATTDIAREITDLDLGPGHPGPEALVAAIASLRLRKEKAELDEIREAGSVTRDGFVTAMRATAVGVAESELTALVEHAFARRQGRPAYETILTVRGEVLHNHDHSGVLRDGDLVLTDAGAEMPSGWCADLTRTWPASGRFTSEQRDVYEIVLAAQKAALAAVRPGVAWSAVHRAAALVITEGLVSLGVLRGEPASLVERGAHALFFPHGVGHHLGLDPHDFETFGDRILYGSGRERAQQFGTAYLRTDVDLAPGMVLTVEPGLYFTPAILESYSARFPEALDAARVEPYLRANGGRGFGGVRIEDNLVVTESGYEILNPPLAKEIVDVEAAVSSAREVGAPRA